MQVDLDIVVYAVIAALILGRLWAVLGKRNDTDVQRPNPFVPPPAPPAVQEPQQMTVPSRMPPVALPPASLAGALAQIQAVDPSFDEKTFLKKAQENFSFIVTAYASNQLGPTSSLLSPALLAHLQQAATTRTEEGQSAQTRVIRFKETEVLNARVEDGKAYITVRFVSDQENIIRDRMGAIIGGQEGKAEEATDIWVFVKTTGSQGTAWTVTETRS